MLFNCYQAPSYAGVCNVEFNFRTYFNLLLNKVIRMFEWENLPETIDQRFLETQLLLAGKACFFKDNDNYYCLNGNWGGEPNVYYYPTIWTVANPILGSKQLKVRQKDGSNSTEGLQGIVIGNSDSDLISEDRKGGLYNLIYQTAGLLADNISSLNVAQINGRAAVLYTADSEAEALSGEKVLQDIYEGHPYRILSQNILEKIGASPIAASGTNNTLMSLIEAHQYILAQFFNEIGIGGNWNMKRERINTAETELMTDSLDINIQSMLKCRQEAVAKINELFGLSISVKLNENVYSDEEDKVNDANSDGELQPDGVEEDTIEVEEPAQDNSKEVEEVKETNKEVDKNE